MDGGVDKWDGACSLLDVGEEEAEMLKGGD